ncbi:MAG: efflux RND transporter periplasmic adaptor subunit [Pseudomonadota bacterium]
MNLQKMRAIGALVLATTLVTACGRREAAPHADASDNVAAKAASGTAHAAAEQASAEKKGEAELAMSGEEVAAAGIKTALLQEQEVGEQIAVTATIGANQDRYASIAPRVAGKVARVLVSQGDRVMRGQTLALIDSVEAGEAQSLYAQAATEAALANSAVQRAEKLFADQIIPQKDYLRARADADKTRAVLRAASERRHALGIGDSAQRAGEPSVFPVLAPFDGTVVEKKAVLGELAQPDKALFAVADMSNVWIETDLFEKDLAKVKLGVPASVTVAAYPDQVFQGKVTYISSVMDKETRTIKARVDVSNGDGKLKLGMFANAQIGTAGVAKALLLPQDAVVLIQGQATAFIQDGHGFAARPVELGDKLRGQVVVKGGIRAGETVVVHGAYALKAKMLKSQISAD